MLLVSNPFLEQLLLQPSSHSAFQVASRLKALASEDRATDWSVHFVSNDDDDRHDAILDSISWM